MEFIFAFLYTLMLKCMPGFESQRELVKRKWYNRTKPSGN